MKYSSIISAVCMQGSEMYVSNARAAGEEGKSDAFDRQFVKLNMQQLFSVPKPK